MYSTKPFTIRDYLIIIMVALTVILGNTRDDVAEAATPVCPCWDIEAVRQAVVTEQFPCQTRADVQALRGAVAQSINSSQDFHLEAYVITAQEQHQAWCKCFSNPFINGCIEDEIKGLGLLKGQVCIDDITRLCEETRKP